MIRPVLSKRAAGARSDRRLERLRHDRLRLHMSSPADDPVIRQLREQLSDTDRGIVEAINKRLELVAQLKRYKESRGIEFVDPDREEWMLRYLTRANRGPLTAEGLAEIYAELLALSKREVGRSEE
jgi:chorismate mutase